MPISHWTIITQMHDYADFIEGVFPDARGHELANSAQQVAPRQKPRSRFYPISRSLAQ